MAELFIGTSGYQYDEWKGSFYPERLAKPKMLAYYAERFPAVEINYTFRQLPKAETLTSWSGQTPAGFRFCLKASQRITHQRRLRGAEEATDHFVRTARTLGEKLGPHLFQLPPYLSKDAAVLRDFLALLPPDQRHAFEFRHDSWFDDEVLGLLEGARAALVVAEHEDGKATPVVRTAPFAYLRLRRPDYEEKDFAAWAGRVSGWVAGGADVFCFFKHEDEGKGPKFAAALLAATGAPAGSTPGS